VPAAEADVVKGVGAVEIELQHEFERETSSVWLNTAHQGRLPKRAAVALSEAIEWKLHPEALASPERFTEIPHRLRQLLARVVGAREDDVVLANSASYGLHLVANGLDLRRGDVNGIEQSAFHLVSSRHNRSTLALLAAIREPSETLVERLTAAGVHIAHRSGRIGISPHVYNTAGDNDRAGGHSNS
jgi:kynureninase